MEHTSTLASPSQSVFRRKLNRDPDKKFHELSSDGKVLVSSLRTALEEAKQRIVTLRDENDEKDDIIEQEKSHRIALEEKMEKYLVDLYQNPSVNDELHQRLPRAKKKGLLFQRHEDEAHDAGSESSDVELNGPSDYSQLPTTDPSSQFKTESQNQVDQPSDDVMTSFVATSQQSAPQTNETGAIQPPHNLMASSGLTTATYPTSIFPALPGNSAALPYYAPMYQHHQHFQPQPLASSSMTSLASSSYMGLPSVTLNNQGTQETSSGQQRRQHSDPNYFNPIQEGHQDTQQTMPKHPSVNNPHPYTIFNLPAGTTNTGIGGHQQTPVPPLNLNTSFVPLSLFGTGFIPSSEDRQDNVSHMTRLLQEISVLKKENKELKAELKEQKRDLELLKVTAGEDDGKKNIEAINALIQEVKQAEKEGERAVSQLIQSANEDRNAALHELDRIRLKAAKRNLTLSSNSQTDGSHMEEIEENDFADSILASDSDIMPSENDEPRVTSLRMEKLLERQKEITKQQIAAVTAQRDDALDKVNRLRKKLAIIKASEFPNATNQNLQAKLKITEKERDIAVRKLQLLSHDMNEVTLMYNLQKALLTDDVNIHSNTNHPSSKLTNANNTEKNGKTSRIEALEKADDEKEKPTSKFEAKLKSLERENIEKDKRIEKLEALVLRQRKKLNTLCAGPLLMDD